MHPTEMIPSRGHKDQPVFFGHTGWNEDPELQQVGRLTAGTAAGVSGSLSLCSWDRKRIIQKAIRGRWGRPELPHTKPAVHQFRGSGLLCGKTDVCRQSVCRCGQGRDTADGIRSVFPADFCRLRGRPVCREVVCFPDSRGCQGSWCGCAGISMWTVLGLHRFFCWDIRYSVPPAAVVPRRVSAGCVPGQCLL